MIKLLNEDAFRPKVRACIDRYLSLSDKYALTLGLYHCGELYAFGSAPDTLSFEYDIGSVSKTVTAHLILHLQELGLLNINKSVSCYLDLPSEDYPTVYELLTHTAGYGHLTPVEITLPSLIGHGYARKNVYESCTCKEVMRSLKVRKRKRNAKYGYSDFAYAILALIAERVTHTPFAELLENFLINELDMKHTVIEADPTSRRPRSAIGKQTVDFWKWHRDNPYIAGGGLVSNIEDMLKYVSMQIESSAPFINKAHTLCTASLSNGKNEAMCIGWHTYKKSNQLWHVGGVGTFRSSVIFNKCRSIGVVVLGNAKGISSANVHYLAKMLYSEIKINKIDFSKEKNT